MAIKDLITRNRTFRRFYENDRIDEGTLRELVDLARRSASAGNLQPIKYVLSSDPEMNEKIFPTLAWAGYLQDWPGPEEGERPSAYITIVLDTQISKSPNCDHGIASQSIMLGAADRGLGGCIIGSIKRDELREALSLDDRYEILLVLALGRPKEKVALEEVGPDGSIRYWRDPDGIHHVPKRSMNEIII